MCATRIRREAPRDALEPRAETGARVEANRFDVVLGGPSHADHSVETFVCGGTTRIPNPGSSQILERRLGGHAEADRDQGIVDVSDGAGGGS